MPVVRFGGMSARRLGELVDRFPSRRIAVLGDFFLDKYLDVDPLLAETSIETGKTAHQVVGVRHAPGAAGTVASNLAALGTRTIQAIGLTGDDGESYDLRKGLTALGCHIEHLHREPDRATPTYLKPRDNTDPSLAGEHERYDTKNRSITPVAVERRILASLDAVLPHVDAVIVLDQVEEADCGVVTAAVRRGISERARAYRHVIFWADSRRHIRQFRHVLIKANQFEVAGRENPPPGEAVDLSHLIGPVASLRAVAGAPVFTTRGAAGVLLSDPELTVIAAVRVDGPTDPTGAGDSATAGAVMALAAGAELAEAALVGNLVASITVRQLAATGTARPQQLAPQLELWRQQQAFQPDL